MAELTDVEQSIKLLLLENIRSVKDFPKPGKLPAKTEEVDYELEYGTDSLEIHSDAIKPGAKVLIHDDLIAA